MQSVSQHRVSIRSHIIAFVLKTVLVLFGVMVVWAYVHGFFVSITSDRSPVWQGIVIGIATSVPFVLGWLINKKQPGHAIALLFLIMAYSLAVGAIAEETRYLTESLSTPYAASIHSIALVLREISWMPSVLFYVFLIPLYFPTGKLLSPRWRALVIFVLGIQIWSAIAFIFRPWPWPATGIRGTRAINGISGSERFFDTVQNLLVIPALLAVLFILISVFLRYRRSRGVERIQMKWPTAALILYIFMFLLMAIVPGLATIDAALGYPIVWSLVMLFPISIGIAILRHRLFDIDILISRTLVYGSLSALIAAIYVAIVAGLGAMFQAQTNTLNGLIAAAIIAVLFQPVRDRLQRGVNRLLYGERDDPAAVLTRLAHHLEAADTPTAILPNLVQTIAHVLKIPYVAIWLPAADRMQPVAVWGEASDPMQTIPLTYQNEAIGHLVVTPRGPQERFNRHEQDLLATIAALTATTVRAVHLSDELRQSRQRIVSAREEERRRLRRDLHDGLGPRLASQSLKLEAARDCLRRDSERAEALLTNVLEKSQDMIADVRQLVYGLRPPALDELGLVDALREHVRQTHLNGAELALITSPEELTPLPAAVEVAAYRIVQEALNNVIRHAHARTCQIAVKLVSAGPETTLRLEIRDDGIGLSHSHHPGIGTVSMRERAEELGGRCIIESVPDGGTRVFAEIPVNPLNGGHHEG